MRNKLQTEKQPKTIKVSTLVRYSMVALAVLVSYILGGVQKSHADAAYNASVQSDAQVLVKSLK